MLWHGLGWSGDQLGRGSRPHGSNGSLNKLGDVDMQEGNLAGAHEHFARSLAIKDALATADPDSAQASFDVVCSLERMAQITTGDEQRHHLHTANERLDAMDTNGQLRGYKQREATRDSVKQWLSNVRRRWLG